MANLAKLEFIPLDITGKNYMSWIIDVEMHLEAMGLSDTIKEDNNSSSQDKAKSIIFLRRHLDESLKCEYLTVKDPNALWKNLKERYDHQKEVILPATRDEWNALRFQDFKKVSEYNSAMFRIVSQMKFCGLQITDEEMLEKTYSTFHASHITLQQQYRLRGFKKYSELISSLLVAEKNNELLIKNHQTRPTGSTAFPEVNATFSSNYKPEYYGQNRGRGRGSHGRGRGRGRGRGYKYNQGRGRGRFQHSQQEMSHKRQSNKRNDTGTSRNPGDSCYRCGSKGHWSRVCRTPEHLCRLYKESLEKGKVKEVNFQEQQDPEDDLTHLDASDFTDDVDHQNANDN